MRAAASVTVTTIRAESWIAISCDTALDKRGYQAVHSRFHVENVRIMIANRDRPSGTAPTFKVGRGTPPTYRPPQARLSSSRTVVNAKRQTSTVNDATVKSLDLSLSPSPIIRLCHFLSRWYTHQSLTASRYPVMLLLCPSIHGYHRRAPGVVTRLLSVQVVLSCCRRTYM